MQIGFKGTGPACAGPRCSSPTESLAPLRGVAPSATPRRRSQELTSLSEVGLSQLPSQNGRSRGGDTDLTRLAYQDIELGAPLFLPLYGHCDEARLCGCTSHSAHRMDDEEDDVFEPDPHCWRSTFREIKCQDRCTQTPGPALPPNNGMLPCGVAEEPRPLFYGNAGFRLHFPAHFELVGDLEQRRQESEEEQNGMEQIPWQQPLVHSVEACIGQKLQLIGDQFHREHLQLYHRNQRNQGPLWWQLAAAVLGFLFDRGFIARGGGAGRR